MNTITEKQDRNRTPGLKVFINKNGQASVNIPKAIAQAKGLRHKQPVEWVIDNVGQMILRPKV